MINNKRFQKNVLEGFKRYLYNNYPIVKNPIIIADKKHAIKNRMTFFVSLTPLNFLLITDIIPKIIRPKNMFIITQLSQNEIGRYALI